MLVDRSTGEMFVYGPIGPDFWDDEAITAESFIRDLGSMGGKRVTVRINSPGGYVTDGVAIYNALRRYPGGVDVVVDAMAASIASVIALAGESRKTAPGARWMIHRAMVWAGGNINDLKKVVAALEAADKSIVEIYRQVMTGDIEGLLDAETWFTADEAVEVGLSTGKDEHPVAAKPKIAAWFQRAPEALYREAEVAAVTKPRYPVLRQAALLKSRLQTT